MRSREEDLNRELRDHLDLAAAERQESGDSPEDARFSARRSFGNFTLVEEDTRRMWASAWLDRLRQDLRYAWRTLRRSPGFALTAICSLALGIGANAAIFNLIDAVLLRMLPVQSPEQLVQLKWGEAPDKATSHFTYPMFEQLREQHPFSAIFTWSTQRFWIGNGPASEPVDGMSVSGGYYPALRVQAVLGRTITPEDDRPGSTPVAVVSYRYWQRAFGGDPGIVGRRIKVEGVSCAIIGVTQPSFFGTDVGRVADVAVPVSLEPLMRPGLGMLEARASIWLRVMARRRPDISLGQAQAKLDTLWPAILEEIMPANYPPQAQRDFRATHVWVSAGGNGLSDVRSRFSKALFVMMGVVAMVLVIACANVANLLLARAAARQREMAVRVAIGAGRARLLSQMLTESTLLAALGGALGIFIAYAGTAILLRLISTRLSTISIDATPDWRTFVFLSGVTLITVALFGLVPAWRATRIHGTASFPALNQRGSAGTSRWSLSKALVAGQVALSLVLLAGAALFTRSLSNLASLDLGFRPDGLLLIGMDPKRSGYQGAPLANFYDQFLERVATLPGVRSATISSRTQVNGDYWNSLISPEGYTPRPGEDMYSNFNTVGPRYFETIGTPLIAGRDFTAQDNENATTAAIVNESIARAYYPSGDAVGRHISAEQDPARTGLLIVGVVKDAKYLNLREQRSHTVFLPYRQHLRRLRGMIVTVRAEHGAAGNLPAAIRHEAAGFGRDIPLTFRTMPEQVGQLLVQDRMVAILSSFFGALALVLAAIGLYGVMAYGVTRRTGEIGIRIALGAQRRAVLWLLWREALALALTGVAIGAPAAFAAGRLISTMLFGLTPGDPSTLLAVVLILTAVVMAAGYIPARRAMRMDPLIALRYE